MRSQYNTVAQKHWTGARYNSNNAWLYNYNNGRSNNNNLYNDLYARLLDYDTGESGFSEFRDFLAEMYDSYIVTRHSKRGKATQMEFEMNLTANIVNLAAAVWNQEYIPSESICFMLEKPKLREVIAAWFGDRIVQTWYCLKLEPFLEEEYYDDQTYSCRKGKGGLRAALDFQEHLRQATFGWMRDDVWIVTRDIRACFPTIDTALLEDEMCDFIWSVICEDEELRNRLCWLTRIIYRTLPQNHCRVKTHPLAWEANNFDPNKSSFGKTRGLAIGNRSSQQAVLFRTTKILTKLRERGYNRFAHYTDDTPIVITDKKQWRIDEVELEREISDELHWEWHPKKKYMQHWTKGVTFLGYKIKGPRLLPSDRVVHNFKWKVACAVRKAGEYENYVFATKESFMQTVNSYLGLLKWCNANRLREEVMDTIAESGYSKVYDFNDGRKLTIKTTRTRRSYFMFLNRERKHMMLDLAKPHNNTPSPKTTQQ